MSHSPFVVSLSNHEWTYDTVFERGGAMAISLPSVSPASRDEGRGNSGPINKSHEDGGLMERIWKILRKRFLLIALLAFLTVFGSHISSSHGEEINKLKYGFSVFGGVGDVFHRKPDLTTYGFLPRIGLRLLSILDLELEGNYTYWNIRKEHDLYFLGANANLVFKPIQGKWGSLFLLGGAGIGYDSAGKRVEQIGDQHLGGILQAGAGVYYNLGKRLAIRVEYRLCHISEPLKNDRGLNSHNVLLGISY